MSFDSSGPHRNSPGICSLGRSFVTFFVAEVASSLKRGSDTMLEHSVKR